MDHSNKQVLLFGVWKKLDISLSAAMADHGKTGNFISVTRGIFFSTSTNPQSIWYDSSGAVL
jgi:hypothetical protein